MNGQIVISLNDFPEEVCAPGTTEEQAHQRCLDLKRAYIKARHIPEYGHRAIYFHWRRVPVWTQKGEQE